MEGISFFIKQLITYLEPIKLSTMILIHFITAVTTSRRQDIIDELDGTMILRFNRGLTAEEFEALDEMATEDIEILLSSCKRDDVVGLVI
jgi:hypothetical protein